MSEAKGTKHSVQALITFGEQLLKTGDLDPVYIAIDRAELPYQQVNRMLLAYFCFYHLGAAAWISEYTGEDYWATMEVAARNETALPGMPGERWPRGSERRHFRGAKCVAAVQWLAARASKQPERLITELITSGAQPLTLSAVTARVGEWPLFGPWIAFKVADVIDRVVGSTVIFPEDLTLVYKEPRAALGMLDVPVDSANDLLLSHFKKFPAPPRNERPCNVQEVETICCKWKSSVGGHYWVGKDIHEIRKGLRGWGRTADRLRAAMPSEVEREGLFSNRPWLD